MRARILRGAHEIGGSCIELLAQGSRIALDLGRPLSAAHGLPVPLPAVSGLDGQDPSLAGVVLSHLHLDHCGLMPQVAASVPVYVGAAAERMLREAAFFTGSDVVLKASGHLHHRTPLQIGPFRITPFLNDHSAFDAYGMLVEADGKRLYYTGDLRGHGRKSAMFEELLANPPAHIQVLLMEGTHVHASSAGGERGPSETDVERACIQTFRATKGMALAVYSAQNIDRLVTLFRAAVQSERELVLDLYTATMAAATGHDSIPQADWQRVRVYVPQRQRVKIKNTGEFQRCETVRPRRIFAEELAARRGELVMTFRASMAAELVRAGCLEDATAVWSLWPGYLQDDRRLQDFLRNQGIPLVVHHSSGHAFIGDLQRLVAALAPARLVPIHSFGGDSFDKFFPHVDRQVDGAWWEV